MYPAYSHNPPYQRSAQVVSELILGEKKELSFFGSFVRNEEGGMDMLEIQPYLDELDCDSYLIR